VVLQCTLIKSLCPVLIEVGGARIHLLAHQFPPG
jgi:hypothetical protein